MDEEDLSEGDVVRTYLYGLLTGMLMKHASEVDDVDMSVDMPTLDDNGIYVKNIVVHVNGRSYRIDIDHEETN